MIKYVSSNKYVPQIFGSLVLGAVLGLSLAVALPGQSFAQTVPAEIEGTISSIEINEDGVTGTMVVMGITINIPATGVVINSATTSLTLDQAADKRPLPGRPFKEGFVGGTGIVLGNTTASTTPGVSSAIDAVDVFLDPAENVVLGMLTLNDLTSDGCDLEIQGELGVAGTGVPVIFSDDLRYPALPSINVSGFDIDPCTVPIGTGVGVEGYYGDDGGALYIFLMEAEAGDPLASGELVSVARARCKDRLEVRGASTDPTGRVTIYDLADLDSEIGDVDIIEDLEIGEGTYNFRENVNDCPSEIRVVHDNGASTDAVVD